MSLPRPAARIFIYCRRRRTNERYLHPAPKQTLSPQNPFRRSLSQGNAKPDSRSGLRNPGYADKLGKAEAWGIALNGVGLAENDYYLANCPEEVRAAVADTLAKVTAGEVEVKDTLEMTDYDTEWPELLNANRVE